MIPTYSQSCCMVQIHGVIGVWRKIQVDQCQWCLCRILRNVHSIHRPCHQWGVHVQIQIQLPLSLRWGISVCLGILLESSCTIHKIIRKPSEQPSNISRQTGSTLEVSLGRPGFVSFNLTSNHSTQPWPHFSVESCTGTFKMTSISEDGYAMMMIHQLNTGVGK